MGRHLAQCIIAVLVIFLFACKKNPNSIAKNIYTSPKMNGNWIGIGSGFMTQHPSPPDAFTQFSLMVVNDTSVSVNGDTLYFKSIDPKTGVISFFNNPNPYYSNSGTLLKYDSVDNAMELSHNYFSHTGGVSMHISTSQYKPDPLVKNYITEIIGAPPFSGKGYDTALWRTPNDSMYDIHTVITFSKVNDSTIAFDKDFAGLTDKELHYKSTNKVTGIVTFQTFHTYVNEISTLTYNYITKQLAFEQRNFIGSQSIRILLQ